MFQNIVRIIAIACLCCSLVAFAAEDKRRWNLQEVDIKTVVEEVSRVTGKNFILDPSVSGRITMISATDLDAEETYQVFLSALQVLGYAAVPTGDVIKILPDAVARHADGLVDDGSAEGDVVVARVIPMQFVSATQVVPTLRNLVSPQGHLAAYAPSNSLIVADKAQSAQRIAEIVKRLDVEDADGMEVIKLEHASSSEVVNALGQMIAQSSRRSSSEGVSPLMLSSDERTNSILVSGDKTRRLQVRSLIAQLDIPVADEGHTEVIYLKYQKAEDLVPVLANVLDSYASQLEQRSNQSNGGSRRGQNQPAIFGMTAALQQNQNNQNVQDNAAGREAAGVVVGSFGVQAEPNTNALIVTAPPSLMRNIRSVVSRLDVRRAQVLVEAIIVEVTGDVSNEWGIEWRGGGSIAGGTSFPSATQSAGLLNTFQTAVNNGTDLLPGSGLTVGFIRGGSLRFLLHAMEATNDVNILSTPSLVAMDNVAAEIKVGSSIPFPIGEYATTGDVKTVTPFITTEYRDVGLSLSIVPQITTGESVQLEIIQKVDTLGPMMNDKPTTTNREVTTKVIVDDSDILVLGGLIQTHDKNSLSKVPFLGDIPILGKAFQSEHSTSEKTNLMVFLRPVILRDAAVGHQVTNSKYNAIRNLQILGSQADNYTGDPALNGTLPPWEYQDVELPAPFEQE